LKGLITSVQNENSTEGLDLRLFSPGYMDTGLLPKNAWPRQGGQRIFSTDEVANQLLTWLENSSSANKHQVFE
jgi:hypothetical protein